jgi:hypothetical protein
MSLDWPATGEALWKISDQTGIRPEYVLPVIHLESGFDPSIVNPGGCVGTMQLCPGTYESYVSVPVSEYRSWPASQQLAGPALTYWRNALRYGQIRSATRLMQAQLAPGELSAKPSLDSVVYRAPSGGYEGNKGVFDSSKKGFFTEQDLANVMAKHVASSAVRDAIARTYALRPNERPHDPVYGDDYYRATPYEIETLTPSRTFLTETLTPPRVTPVSPAVVFTVSALVLAGAAGFAIQRLRARRENFV